MAAYMIVRVRVTDPEQYAEYMKLTPDIVAQFGGTFIVRGGDVVTLEGEAETRRMVVVEFPSSEQAQAFYHSEAYQAAIAVRRDAAEAQFIVVEGA